MSRLFERLNAYTRGLSEAHFRQFGQEVKDVIRLLEDALAGLRPGLSNTPEAGDTIINNFGEGVPQPDDDHYWWTAGDLQAAESTRSSGITWRTRNVFPHRMEFHAKLTPRYYLSDYLRTAVGGSLGFSEAKYTFDEAQAYSEDPAAATWRGLDIAGTVTVSAVAGTGGGGTPVILNTTLDSWSGSPAFTPYWALNGIPGGQVSPGEGGTGSAIYIERSSGGDNGSFITNHVTGSGTAINAPYNLDATATMAKDVTWVLQFSYRNFTAGNKLGISILAQSTVTYNVPLNSSYAGLSNTGGTSGTIDGSSTQDFDISATQSWQTGLDQVITLTNVPADSTYRTYTITFTTTGMAGTVADPFYPRIYFACLATGGAAYLELDNISLMPVSNPATIDTSLTERALTLDDFTYAPTLTASGDSLLFDEVTGAWLVPTMAPVTVAGSTVTATAAYGAVTGFELDAAGHDGTLTVADVFSHYALRPKFGTAAWNIGMAANAGLWTAFRTGTQAANIGYTLPVAQGAAATVLTNDGAGTLAWTAAGSVPGVAAGAALAWLTEMTGEEGAMGPPGLSGPAGAAGSAGALGPMGPAGYDGEDGLDGSPGPVGPAGAAGVAGAAGSIGPPGQDGEEGPEGMAVPGPAGAAGAAGVPGAMGMPGLDGVDGEMGMPVPGPQGATGPQGVAGPPTPGPPGTDGEDGEPGRPGINGATGLMGPMGPPGLDGTDLDEHWLAGTPLPNTDDGTTLMARKRAALREVSPTSLAADQNNYNPGDTASVRLTASTTVTITGLANGTDGRLLLITNISSDTIYLANESGSSTAGNRITTSTGQSVAILGGQTAITKYDATSSRWRVTGYVTGVGVANGTTLTNYIPMWQGTAPTSDLGDSPLGLTPAFIGNTLVLDDTLGAGITGFRTQTASTVPFGDDTIRWSKGYFDQVVPKDVIQLLGQSTDITTTTFPSTDDGVGGGNASGLYRISVYIDSPGTALAVSTVRGRISWRDGNTTRSQDTATVNLVATAQTNLTLFINASTAGGMGVGPITYETITVGVPGIESFDFYATLEKLSD